MQLLRVLGILVLAFSTLGHAAPDAGTRLQEVLDRHWAWYLEEFPETRSYLGLSGGNDRWNDVTPEAQARRDRQRSDFLRQLADIDPSGLEEQQRLSHAMLTRRLQSRREHYRLGLHLMALNMREGPQHSHTTAEYLPFDTVADYRNWLARLRSLPVMLAGHTELLREGIARQRVQSRAVMSRLPGQIDRIVTERAEDSPFYKPFLEMPADIDSAQAAALRREAAGLIRSQVNPAYADFREFFVETYLPAARPSPGVGSLPGGKEIYRFLARDYTTTDLTPEQIHATGKAEVERILVAMEAVKREADFEGDLAAFNEFLRSDARFYYQTPEELLQAYRAVAKQIDPELVRLFGRLPRMPYGVRPIPEEVAPDTTTAYYMEPAANGSRAGNYYVNLYRPEVRPKYEMEVLSVHEAVPGHHLQIALAQEIQGLPEFRRESSVTAFVEGWALYSERLGYSLGLYRDPWSRYGQLTYDMWRAVRLVVDTGIHYFGWSRQQGIDYFARHAGKTETDIVNEVDRYIGWPGQALAYKIGQLKILEIRELAEQTLADAFDIRAFHDHLLGAGAIPLDALEERMALWLQQQDR